MINLKYIIFSLFLSGALLCSTGCGTISKIIGKNTTKEQTQKAKIVQVDAQLTTNTRSKLTEVSSLSYGVDVALDKEINASTNVKVAKDLNIRVLSLTGTPSIEEMNRMKQMVDDLTSQLRLEKERGAKALASKDKDIQGIQTEEDVLLTVKETEVKKYMDLAAVTASKADASQAQLNQMNRWGGLGAIWYGIKRLIIRLAWVLGIGSMLFIILRVASMSNPIASAIFGIFDQIGSWAVHTIQFLIPKAVSLAGNVSTSLFNSYKSTMVKIVDAVQMAKNNAAISGKTPSVEDVVNQLEKTMSLEEKAIVNDIKKQLNWK
jgi:hypothetical protein